jgi:hypothetical protein
MLVCLRLHDFHVVVRLSGETDAVGQWLGYVQPYLTASSESDTVAPDLELDIEMTPSWVNPKGGRDLEFERENGVLKRVRFEKPALSGSLIRCPKGYYGRFTTNGDFPDSIDYAICAALSFLCEQKGELLLHASCVLRSSKAWLFLGEGGAGKTTIAVELNGGGEPMSVDRTLVSVDGRGEFEAFSTPFGDRTFEVKRVARAPIGGLVFIEKADEHEVSRLDVWQATTRLLRQTVSVSREPSDVSAVLKGIGLLAERGYAYGLKFTRDDSFWELLAREDTGR